MSGRLQPLNLTDFTGGLNLRRSDFQLDDSESPIMLNMEVDPRGGFYTRAGWERWNDDEAVADPVADWRPRSASLHPYSSGEYAVFVSNDDKVWAAQPGDPWVDLGCVATADPHLADVETWGDTTYIACGRANPVRRVIGAPDAGNLGTNMTAAAAANWNDDYTIPVGGVMPRAEHIEAHGGYVFVANTSEDGTSFRSRLRWSHPGTPEDWAELDFIDIEQGGSQITGLMSFQDHLLIFKLDSMWALFGYDADSWQLIKVSASVGVTDPTSITRSENAVYFYSSSGRNGIYSYQGGTPVDIGGKLREALDTFNPTDDVWLGWIGHRLWVSTPYDPRPSDGSHGSVLIYDPELYEGGMWIRHKPALGTIACIVQHSDIGAEYPMVVPCGCSGISSTLLVDTHPDIAGDIMVTGEPAIGFDCRYRTGWKHAGWPELQKSWLRPRIVARVPQTPVVIRMGTYWNYDPNNERRNHGIPLTASDGLFWRDDGAADPGGWDWGDGSVWAAATQEGDTIVRSRPTSPTVIGSALGWARAVQLEFAPEDHTLGLAWGIDAVILKYNARRFTT